MNRRIAIAIAGVLVAGLMSGIVALTLGHGVVGARASTVALKPIVKTVRGSDDPPGHDAEDDRGAKTSLVHRRGSDDPPGHDAEDDRGAKTSLVLRRGSDDLPGHDAGDD